MAAIPVGAIPVPLAVRRARSQARLSLVPALPTIVEPPFDFEVACPTPVRTTHRPVGAADRAARAGRARKGIVGRLVPGAITLTVLAGVWYGAGALTGLRPGSRPGVRAPGATLVAGADYTVQPGDTLWSIALRLDPSGDPRPLVDELGAELGGALPQPGEQLVLP